MSRRGGDVVDGPVLAVHHRHHAGLPGVLDQLGERQQLAVELRPRREDLHRVTLGQHREGLRRDRSGSVTVACRMTSAIACFFTTSPAFAIVTADASFGVWVMKLAIVVTPPGQRGAGAGRVVVGPLDTGSQAEMDVRVDAARQDELAGRVDDPRAGAGHQVAAELGDRAVADADVALRAAGRVHHHAVANQQLRRLLRGQRRRHQGEHEPSPPSTIDRGPMVM